MGNLAPKVTRCNSGHAQRHSCSFRYNSGRAQRHSCSFCSCQELCLPPPPCGAFKDPRLFACAAVGGGSGETPGLLRLASLPFGLGWAAPSPHPLGVYLAREGGGRRRRGQQQQAAVTRGDMGGSVAVKEMGLFAVISDSPADLRVGVAGGGRGRRRGGACSQEGGSHCRLRSAAKNRGWGGVGGPSLLPTPWRVPPQRLDSNSHHPPPAQSFRIRKQPGFGGRPSPSPWGRGGGDCPRSSFAKLLSAGKGGLVWFAEPSEHVQSARELQNSGFRRFREGKGRFF